MFVLLFQSSHVCSRFSQAPGATLRILFAAALWSWHWRSAGGFSTTSPERIPKYWSEIGISHVNQRFSYHMKSTMKYFFEGGVYLLSQEMHASCNVVEWPFSNAYFMHTLVIESARSASAFS